MKLQVEMWNVFLQMLSSGNDQNESLLKYGTLGRTCLSVLILIINH